MTPADLNHLVVFARNPVAGKVKTRLIPALGAEGATALYREMLEATLLMTTQVRAAEVSLWCDTPGETCKALADVHGIGCFHQRGADLGARMHDAFSRQFLVSQRVILIGSDCPGLTADYLDSAFELLHSRDAVIGPAMDGGYVMIGLKRPEPGLFEQIQWGSRNVLDQTRARFRQLGLDASELVPLHDIDTPGDLAHYPQYHASYSKYRQTTP